MTQKLKTGGRTTGTPNRRTVASRRHLQTIADPMAFLASVLRGDAIDGAKPTLADRMAAARELRRVMVPDCRERPLSMTLPPVDSIADFPAAFSAVIAAVGAGQVT